MQLYLSLTSPYARKVRVCLMEKAIPFEAIDVATSGRSAKEQNPLGKVPTLVLDDGTVLFDSTVIVEALDALYPSPRLIPSEPMERALVRRAEAVADGICDVLVPHVLETRRPSERQDTAYATRQYDKARSSLEYLNTSLGERPYAHGHAFTLADIAIVSAVGYANLRVPRVLEGLPELQRYVSQQLARPSLRDTIPPNLPIRG
jgi:glutathione S-transferase